MSKEIIILCLNLKIWCKTSVSQLKIKLDPSVNISRVGQQYDKHENG